MEELVASALRRDFFGINNHKFVKFEMTLDQRHEASTYGAVSNDTNGSRNLMINFPHCIFLHS